jgi:hypothetical protein
MFYQFLLYRKQRPAAKGGQTFVKAVKFGFSGYNYNGDYFEKQNKEKVI